VLVRAAYCETHQAEVDAKRQAQRLASHQDYNKRRDSSDAFYKTYAWRKFSKEYRLQHPLCQACKEAGRIRQADLVDHIQPFKLRPDLAFALSNVRPLCHECHNALGAKVGITGRGQPKQAKADEQAQGTPDDVFSLGLE
jgi:5-methylcytosine-specific restriction endonuclease McrA